MESRWLRCRLCLVNIGKLPTVFTSHDCIAMHCVFQRGKSTRDLSHIKVYFLQKSWYIWHLWLFQLHTISIPPWLSKSFWLFLTVTVLKSVKMEQKPTLNFSIRYCTYLLTCCTYLLTCCTYLLTCCTYLLTCCTYLLTCCTYLLTCCTATWLSIICDVKPLFPVRIRKMFDWIGLPFCKFRRNSQCL